MIFCSLGYAQLNHLIFRHFNRANGLPVDEVTCLAQDSSGFIWIGSKEGLFRFDGFTYKEFYSNPSQFLALPNNYISTIYVDAKGLLWIGTLGGIVLMQNDGAYIIIGQCHGLRRITMKFFISKAVKTKKTFIVAALP